MSKRWLIVVFCVYLLSACVHYCRIDQQPPADATYEQLEKISKDQCK